MTQRTIIQCVANYTLVTHADLAATDVERAIGISLRQMEALRNDSPAWHAAAVVLRELDTEHVTPLWTAIKREVRRTIRERAERDANIAAMDAILARHGG